uniref:Uncharacterized protein n=1 Tax=Aegilops tauschii subsp. strangulata TaxID=200361 RepID=A0A453NLZ6_AEGTS
SPRIIGFYSNIFGRKTKFFFLWEDIDDIQVVPPSLSTVGSPSLMIILQKDRGLEVRHGAKTQDPQGRLRFHFQTFVSFNDAHRCFLFPFSFCHLFLFLSCLQSSNKTFAMTFVKVWAKRTDSPKRLFLKAFWSTDFVIFVQTSRNEISSRQFAHRQKTQQCLL